MYFGTITPFWLGIIAVAVFLVTFACILSDELKKATVIEENEPFLKSDFDHAREKRITRGNWL